MKHQENLDETIAFAPATELLRKLRNAEVTSRELLELYLERVARLNPSLNAIIYMDTGAARARADAADAAEKGGFHLGKLHGLPVTVKEAHHIAGWPTTWGDPKYSNFIPDRTCLVVQRLMDAGAVVFGKTNVPLNLMDWQTYNAVYGTTHNPWRPDVTPGGSSGGSAAALAAGLTGAELGTDSGGSVRIPAHFCGAYGHRPSLGIVPQEGNGRPGTLVPNELATSGPMARSAEDLQLILDVISGPEDRLAKAWSFKLPPARASRLADFHVSVVYNSVVAEVDEEYIACLHALIEELRAKGARVDEGVWPEFDHREHQRILLSVLRGAVSGRASDAEIRRAATLISGTKAEDHSYAVECARALLQSHRAWINSSERRASIRRAWRRFFKVYDVLLAPVTVSAAFPIDETEARERRSLLVSGHHVDYNDQLFWPGLATLAGLPASVAPIGRTHDGLPVGVQIIGPYLEDRSTIVFAMELERLHRFERPPGPAF